MSNISVLLGAGFSVPEGYKNTSEINDRLKEISSEEIIISPDGTAIFKNGQNDLNPHLTIIEREFVSRFLSFYTTEIINKTEFDYEQFYDYYKKNQSGIIKSSAIRSFFKKFKNEFEIPSQSNANLIGNFDRTFNQLLGELLWKPIDNSYIKYSQNYDTFLNYLKELSKSKKIQVHSLNHDLLFEKLANSSYIESKLDDGFELKDSSYYGLNNNDKKERLSYFTNKYDNKFCLYKLHGSIDQIKFHSIDNSIVAIKTLPSIRMTEFYKEYNDENGNQKTKNCWINYHADFLSGTTEKIKMYNAEYYYKTVIEHFERNLHSSDKLIVVGYSFRDSKINEIINEFFFNSDLKKLIIIDPKIPVLPEYFNNKKIEKIEKSISNVTLEELRLITGANSK